jgi:hypothetical protein
MSIEERCRALLHVRALVRGCQPSEEEEAALLREIHTRLSLSLSLSFSLSSERQRERDREREREIDRERERDR